ncbi:polyamine ABC transporter substrate-binding protein [Thiothrix winogradskyi]|uniref:Putrescine-binding periplasmic protein n=1 Tax=Thiothrix winogradskyi TaxID=96472 RepID=A0ABY3SYG7_9GAMM|nr:polyamine ABC transporter substrate-binding protein [Thiothrix winogradskyi]UJS23873.1 polyamine ABC transporter substrate-binding protein [Thiothrix winogradskyi]
MQFKQLALAIALAVTAVTPTLSNAEEKVLNIYNWSDYFDPAYLKKFEEKTGIKVNYDVYDSNDVLEAKLMAGGSGYDLVVPSNANLERQIKAGIHAPVDKTKLSNYANLDEQLKTAVAKFDTDNAHAVPYTWGTVGIAYNTQMIAKRLGDAPLDSWDALFKPETAAKLADCGIAVMDSASDMMPLALHYLGLNPNSEETADLEKATDLMKSVRSSIKYFHSSKSIADLANGEICMAVGFNGDMLQAKDRAVEAKNGNEIKYIIPKEGAILWYDSMVIPADAKHKEAAHQFMDFVLEPETAASISNFVFYAVANNKAEALIDDEVKNDPGIYPPAEIKAKLFVQQAHGAAYDRKLSRAWSSIKTGR